MENIAKVSDAQLEAWVPKIVSTLKTNWADYVLDVPATQPSPNLSDWLALLHTAAGEPENLPRSLSALLKLPKGDIPPPGDWKMLTTLLSLTFDAAKAHAQDLTSTDWQNIIELQNRILRAAAQVSDDVKAHPNTTTLTRKALYLQAITEIEKIIASRAILDEMLQEIVSLIQQHFGYEYVNLYFLNSAKQVLTLQYADWNSREIVSSNLESISINEGIIGRVAATGQGILVNNVLETPDFVAHPSLSNVKSQLAVPVVADNKTLIGVLDIESDEPDTFTENDQQILQALASHIAIAIKNAHLQKAQQRYAKEQSLIYDTIATLSTENDVENMLSEICKKIVATVDAGACVITRVDKKSPTITPLAEYVVHHSGNPVRTWRNLNVSITVANDTVAKQAVKTAKSTIIRASTDDPARWQLAAGSQTTNDDPRWSTALAIPFEINKRVIGLVEIYDKRPNRTFSNEDIQFCRILATQTALVVEQSQLYDETLHRLGEVSMLYTMAQQIASSLDLEDVLNTIVTSLREVIGCRACCIFLLDESDGYLEIKAANGLKPQWRESAKLKLGEGAAGVAAAEARTVYLSDTRKEPGFIFFDKEVQSLMVVPLMAQGQVIGTINVDDRHANAFGSAQERLLTIAAAQAGVSIENARLFSEISAEKQQMQAIIQHMADGLLLIDAHGTIITCNSTLAMMLGMDRGQIVEQNIHAPNLHPNLAKITSSTTRRARTGVLAKEVTVDTPRPRTLQVFATTMINANKEPVGEVRVVHDVTKERELEQLKDDFFSTISHELRTPLFSIQGFAQLMLEEGDGLDQETRTEFLTTIQRQAKQLSEMVNNLLDISKFDSGKLVLEQKPLSIIDLISQTVLKLQGYAHKQQVTLITDLSTPLPTIVGDPFRLEQALTNLIGNAIKFSPQNDNVFVTALLKDNGIEILVKDNGIGIPPEALEEVFSRYYQVNNKEGRSAMGTGLGLHITKQIIDGHGGRIWAESETGKGSTFFFTLPLPK